MTYEPVTLGRSVWLPWRVFVMPGATIGDGSVIGADSLVTGDIPPNSLAVGSPAKVIRSAPAFPRPMTASDRAAIVDDIVREFDRFVGHSGVAVSVDGQTRTYARDQARWTLRWVRSDGNVDQAALARGDTLFTEAPLTAETRSALRSRGVDWLDLAGRSRSEAGTPLTEELAQFLGRYGIRLPRDSGR